MSRVNIWYPMFPADMAIDTQHLTAEQFGVYIRILNQSWRQSGKINNDDHYLSRIAGVPLQKWLRIKPEIEAFFNTDEPAIWCSEWLIRELNKATANSEAKRQNALKRWQPGHGESMQMHSNSNANASDAPMQMQCPSPSPSPTSTCKQSKGVSLGEFAAKNNKNLDGQLPGAVSLGVFFGGVKTSVVKKGASGE